MVCTEEPTKVKFIFTNKTEDDLYILKWCTPLEGMKSPFLTIKYGEKEVEYEGVIAKRSSPCKQEYYKHLKPHRPVENTIDLAEAYAFPDTGEYTVQYSNTLVRLSRRSYETLDFDHAPTHIVTATRSIRIKMPKKRNDRRSRSHRCVLCVGRINEIEAREKIRRFEKLFLFAYERVIIKEVDNNHQLYRRWFGGDENEYYKNIVRDAFKKCYNKLAQKSWYGKFKYKFEVIDPSYYAETDLHTKEIILCCLYVSAPDSSENSGDDSKQQTLMHEWMHAYGRLGIDIGYGARPCRELPPDIAIKNADNYGYFYCDVSRVNDHLLLDVLRRGRQL